MRQRKVRFLHSNLTHLRQIAHMSKGELSKIIGTSNTEIGSLESNGSVNPNYFLIEAIADFFGITTESLVRDDLSLRNNIELNVGRAIANLPELSSRELRMALLICDDLVKGLSEKKYFNYRYRSLENKDSNG